MRRGILLHSHCDWIIDIDSRVRILPLQPVLDNRMACSSQPLFVCCPGFGGAPGNVPVYSGVSTGQALSRLALSLYIGLDYDFLLELCTEHVRAEIQAPPVASGNLHTGNPQNAQVSTRMSLERACRRAERSTCCTSRRAERSRAAHTHIGTPC